MSIKKAQKIANKLDEEFGIFLTSYQLSEIERINALLTQFVDLGVETEDLADADDQKDVFGLDEIDEDEDEFEHEKE